MHSLIVIGEAGMTLICNFKALVFWLPRSIDGWMDWLIARANDWLLGMKGSSFCSIVWLIDWLGFYCSFFFAETELWITLVQSIFPSGICTGPATYTASERAIASSHPRPHFARLHQILGSVCYGYGCFHLLLSLLPGHLLKWLKFLGFHGDLQVGIRALTYSMNSPDSKSLLAR